MPSVENMTDDEILASGIPGKRSYVLSEERLPSNDRAVVSEDPLLDSMDVEPTYKVGQPKVESLIVQDKIDRDSSEDDEGFWNQFYGSLESTIFQDNPRTSGRAIEGLGRVSGIDSMKEFGENIVAEFDASPPEEKFIPRVSAPRDVDGLNSALDYIGSTLGQGIGSMAMVVGGAGAGALGGAAVGSVVPGAGTTVGAVSGGATGGAISGGFLLNYGDTYEYLMETEGMDPDSAAEFALVPGAMMAGLDAWGVGKLLGPAKRELSANIIKRTGQLALRGAGTEGVTESAQQVIQESAGEIAEAAGYATEDIQASQRVESILNSFVAGVLTGGVMGGATSPFKKPTEAPPPPGVPEELAPGVPEELAPGEYVESLRPDVDPGFRDPTDAEIREMMDLDPVEAAPEAEAETQGFDTIEAYEAQRERERLKVEEPIEADEAPDAPVILKQSPVQVVRELTDEAQAEGIEKLRSLILDLPEDSKQASDIMSKRLNEMFGSFWWTEAGRGIESLWSESKSPMMAAKNAEYLQKTLAGVPMGTVSPEQYRLMKYLYDNPDDLAKIFEAGRPNALTARIELKRGTNNAVELVVDAYKIAQELGIQGVTVDDIYSGRFATTVKEAGGKYWMLETQAEWVRKAFKEHQSLLDKAGVDYTIKMEAPSRAMLVNELIKRFRTEIWKAEESGDPVPPVPNLEIFMTDRRKKALPRKGAGYDTFGVGAEEDYARYSAEGDRSITLEKLFEGVETVPERPAMGVTTPEDVGKFVESPTGTPTKRLRWYERAAARKRGRGQILRQTLRTRDKLGKAWKTDSGIATISDHEYDIVKEFVAMVGTKRLENIAFAIEPEIATGMMLNEPLGLYFFGKDIVGISHSTIASGRFVGTTIHELWHGLSQYLPDNTVNDLYTQYARERGEFMRQNPEAFDRSGNLTDINMAKNQNTYRFSSFDEWVVEKMKDLSIEDASQRILRKGKGVDPTDLPYSKPWQQALRALADLVRSHYNQIKALFGRDVARATYLDFMQGKYMEQVRSSPLADVIEITAEDETRAAERWSSYLDALDADEGVEAAAEGMSEEIKRFIEQMVVGPAEVVTDEEFKALASQPPTSDSASPATLPETPDEIEAAFTALGEAQRGAPEDAMMDVYTVMPGIYAYNLEHVGDLNWRNTTMWEGRLVDIDEGMGKIKNAYKHLNRKYGFERQVKEQIGSQAKVTGRAAGEIESELRAAGQKYADEHRKLTVYNEVQSLSKEAAIALGEWRFDDARTHLAKLQGYVDEGTEAFTDRASRIQPEFAHPGSTAAKPPAAKLEELTDLKGNTPKLNDDGTITLYHRTSPEAAAEIRRTGKFVSKENTDEVFLSSKRTGQAEGHGSEVVEVRVDPSKVRLDDAFDDEIHVAVKTADVAKPPAATPTNVGTFKSNPDGTLIGYKVMRFDPETGEVVSGADSRIRSKIKAGDTHSMRGSGVFLSSDPQYVVDYYAGHEHNALITYSFEPSKVTSGSLTDKQPEISVSDAVVQNVEVFSENEIPTFAPKPPAATDIATAGAYTPAEIEEAKRLWEEMGTESPYFKNWSGGAPIISEGEEIPDGPVVFESFHGTKKDEEGKSFQYFSDAHIGKSTDTGYSGRGFYFSDNEDTARAYASKFGDDGVVLSTFVRINNPLVLKRNQVPAETKSVAKELFDQPGYLESVIPAAANRIRRWNEIIRVNPNRLTAPGSPYASEAIRMIAERNGHDGIIVTDITGPGGTTVKEFIAFDSTQVKSIENIGTFDPTDPSILKGIGIGAAALPAAGALMADDEDDLLKSSMRG